MSAFYDRMQATATRLIGRYGYAAQLKRAGAPTGPAYDPQPAQPTLHSCTVVETEYSLTNRDATLVQKGDKLGLISTAIDSAPLLSDQLMLADGTYNFVDLQPLSPGGQALLYEFHCRK